MTAAASDGFPPSRLVAVLVTYRRPKQLKTMLRELAAQTRPPEHLVVVDNAPDDETRGIVDVGRAALASIAYVELSENAGPAGGLRAGVATLADDAAGRRTWVVFVDDDDPPPTRDTLASLERRANELADGDPAVAGLGLAGSRLTTRGFLVRPSREELEKGPPVVDYIGGNNYPLYRLDALRATDPFYAPLFWGREELWIGVSLKRAGYRLHRVGMEWWLERFDGGRWGPPRAERRVQAWRSYYTVRNHIWILRSLGMAPAAAVFSLSAGMGKSFMKLFGRTPNRLRHLRLMLRAVGDGWSGCLGRTVEPTACD